MMDVGELYAAARMIELGAVDGKAAIDPLRKAAAEIERLNQRELKLLRDIEVLVIERERLRSALYEGTTNGEWTKGDQCGEWKVSKEVYETMRDAIANEQLPMDQGVAR